MLRGSMKQALQLHCLSPNWKPNNGHVLRRRLVQLAGRPYLPGSDGRNFPAVLSPFRQNFPFIYNATLKDDNVASFGEEIRPKLDELIQEHAAVILRGMPLHSPQDFSKFFLSLRLNAMEYIGGVAVRSQTSESVFTASNDSPDVTMEPHNEMSYGKEWPHLIFFYCQTPPKPGCGGESIITDVREVLRSLNPEVVEKFNRLGVLYMQRMFDKNTVGPDEDYITWQAGTMAETREEAENNIRSRCDGLRWEEDGTLTTWKIGAAMRPHYRTGEMLWFNQANILDHSFFEYHPNYSGRYGEKSSTPYPFGTSYGDGSPIEEDVIQHIRDVTWRHTVGGQLKKSDVLILDNMFVQHGRISFTCPRVLNVALAKYT